MKTICCSLLLFFAFGPLDSRAQKASVKKLEFTWYVPDNASEEGRRSQNVLTITNHSNKPLTSTGWSFYFNSPRHIEATENGNLKVEQVSRDLYRITPQGDFKPILKGQSIRAEWITNGPAINSSDAPKGCYWVWDEKPDAGIAIRNISVVRPATLPGAASAKDSFIKESERIFRRNESITHISEKAIVKIFPTPYAYEEGSGLFMITESTWIKTDSAFEDIGQYLAEELYFLTGKMPSINPGSGDERSRITIRLSDTGPEAYTLKVDPAGIEITASSTSGVFYAIQSLKTLIQPSALKSLQQFIAIPSVEVIDGPRFAHRALLLDVARNFHSKEQLKKVIDLMALYKLNVLHLHLSDDEGWRLEIPGLPELTEIGGKRGHNLDAKRFLSPAFGSGPGWDGSGSGYYSRQDFIEILQYAKLNFVTVIPEIESPAHARAAIVSMNYRYHRKMDEGDEEEAREFLLQDPEDQSLAFRPGWTNNIMDPGLPSTYRFVEKVVDEVIAIYNDAKVPLSLIHIGGNDMPENPWTASPVAVALMKGDPQLRDNQDVRRYFIGRISRILKNKGLPLYGWQEIATSPRHQKKGQPVFPDPEFAHCNVFVDVHKKVNEKAPDDLAFRLANAGYKVVLAPSSEFGFHLQYEEVFDEPGNSLSGYSADSDRPFRFQPFGTNKRLNDEGRFSLEAGIALPKHTGLTDYGKGNIVGIKGLLWSQNLTNPEEMEYMLLPRLLALAQRAWSHDPVWEGEPNPRRRVALYLEDWSHFVNVLGKRELPRLDYYHGGYRYRIPAPGLMVDRGTVSANVQFPGLTLRYTTNGKEPTIKSPRYCDPIPLTEIVKVRAFNSVGRGGRTSTWISPLSLPEYGPEDQDEGDPAYTHK